MIQARLHYRRLLHSLVGPETLGQLRVRRVFVATRGEEPAGFLMASPIPATNEWLTEQFVRGHNASNGTPELIIDSAVQWLAKLRSDCVTLGLAPLSTKGEDLTSHSLLIQIGFKWVRAHERQFYNFEGFDSFNAKFAPEKWEAVYAVANELMFLI